MAETYFSRPTAASDEATPPAYSDHPNYPEPSSVSPEPTRYIQTEEGVKIKVTHVGPTPPAFTAKPIPLPRHIPQNEILPAFLPKIFTEEEMIKKVQKIQEKKESGGLLDKVKKIFRDDSKVTIVYMTAEEVAVRKIRTDFHKSHVTF